jgi:hypothetical protein
MPSTTVLQLKTSLNEWLREDVSDLMAFEAIGDSIVSIWETLVCINLSEFLGGQISATFAPASNVSTIAAADGTEGGNAGDVDDIWYIHSMSVTVPDGSQRFFEGTEVGSELWRAMSRTVAGNSPYQPFVYDFDGSRIIVAPTPVSALTPGYFYVKRPPATVDNTTVVPFAHPGAVPFIRYNAISLIKLAMEEYVASGSWERKAENERLQIVQSAQKKNARKNLRVQPTYK